MRGKASLMPARVRWIKALVQISPFVKIVGRRPIPDSACISKRWLFSDNHPKTWASEKVDFSRVKTPVLFFSVCRPKFTKVGVLHRSDFSLQCYFPIEDILCQSGDICDQFAKLSEIATKNW